MIKKSLYNIKEKFGKEPQLAVIVKSRYSEVRRWFKNSYFVILFITIVIIVLNYETLYSLLFNSESVEINGTLPLLLTIGLFILIVVPLLGLFTRRKCPHCHEIVLRNSNVCHKCGCEIKLYK
ncbi:zinc ribbon domain-containing protein [Mycoplasmatota bacterium WC44]